MHNCVPIYICTGRKRHQDKAVGYSTYVSKSQTKAATTEAGKRLLCDHPDLHERTEANWTSWLSTTWKAHTKKPAFQDAFTESLRLNGMAGNAVNSSPVAKYIQHQLESRTRKERRQIEQTEETAPEKTARKEKEKQWNSITNVFGTREGVQKSGRS